jgi:hypothetical protein
MTRSPESRLLDLIRKKSDPTPKERWTSWLTMFSRWMDRMERDSVDVWRWANGCLALLLAGTLIYGGFIFFGHENQPALERSGTSFSISEPGSIRPKSPLVDLTRRNLFKDMAPPPPPPLAVEIPAGPPPPPKIPLSERASRFRLVGILSGEKPQAIIEDSQTQRMIYASQGQRLEGILVESVTAGKVVLSDGDERFDMTL